jgi:hypothetical protein
VGRGLLTSDAERMALTDRERLLDDAVLRTLLG